LPGPKTAILGVSRYQ